MRQHDAETSDYFTYIYMPSISKSLLIKFFFFFKSNTIKFPSEDLGIVQFGNGGFNGLINGGVYYVSRGAYKRNKKKRFEVSHKNFDGNTV